MNDKFVAKISEDGKLIDVSHDNYEEHSGWDSGFYYYDGDTKSSWTGYVYHGTKKSKFEVTRALKSDINNTKNEIQLLTEKLKNLRLSASELDNRMKS